MEEQGNNLLNPILSSILFSLAVTAVLYGFHEVYCAVQKKPTLRLSKGLQQT